MGCILVDDKISNNYSNKVFSFFLFINIITGLIFSYLIILEEFNLTKYYNDNQLNNITTIIYKNTYSSFNFNIGIAFMFIGIWFFSFMFITELPMLVEDLKIDMIMYILKYI